MQPKLIIGFGSLTEDGFKARAQTIMTSLGPVASPNPDFPEPFPDPYPTRTVLAAAHADYLTKHAAADDGDSGAIAARNEAREVLSNHFRTLAPYLEAVAAGDVAMLEGTGYQLRKSPVSSGPGPIPAPTDVKLVHGGDTGLLVMRAKGNSTAQSFEAQVGTGDPSVEATWTITKLTTGCRRIEFAGLTPGVIYNGRIRAIGPNGPGPWSDVAQLRSL